MNLKMNKCWIIWYRLQVQQVPRKKKKVFLGKDTHEVVSVLLGLVISLSLVTSF